MIEELKAYFQEYLDEKFEKINIRLEDLEKQELQFKELETKFIEHKEQVTANHSNLENQFQTLLKEINNTQQQADEIIEKVSQKIATTQTTQKQSPNIWSDFQQNIQNIYLKEINNTQQKADELIEKKVSQKKSSTQTSQTQPLFILPDFQQLIQSTNQYNIFLQDLNNSNQNDISDTIADNNIQNIATISLPHPKVSQFHQDQNMVFRTRTGSKYHKAYCSFLYSSKIPITIREAMKIGLTSCRVCIG